MNSLSIDSIDVRKTEDGFYSVFDAIRFIAQKKNERTTWKRLVDQHPEVVERTTFYKFTGAGQRETPVADRATILEIIGLLPDDRWSEGSDAGYVYLISAAGMPMVKIGKSRTPEARLATHQIGSPVKLSLVATAETFLMSDTERGLKKFFREFRSHGEWYRVGVDKAQFIFDEAVSACKSFQDVAFNATPEELDKLSALMKLQTKALRESDAKGHSEISAVVQNAADDFQAMLAKFGVI